MPRFKKAFTLIELLIVISIIGILASIVVYSMSPAPQKARDARRKSDLEAIKTALYIAKSDSASASYFPSCENSIGGGCYLTDGDQTNPHISPTYIKTIPLDPKNNPYHYYPRAQGPSQCNNSSANPCVRFNLVACLEYAKDPQAVADSTECPQTGYKYVVTEY